MNIVFSLCDGKLASLSPIYIAIIVIMILSFITGLILTYNEKNNKKENSFVSSNDQINPVSSSLVTTSSDVNHFNVVSTISNDDSFIDHTIRIETLSEGSAANVTDPLPKIDILSIDDASTRDQDVTITYME